MPVDISAAGRPLGTSMSAVSAEPPNCRRSMSTITWVWTPIWTATRFADSNSTTCLWPYRNDMAYGSKPSDRAIARTVVESRPPLNSTTALRCWVPAGAVRSLGCGTPATLLKRVVQHKRQADAGLAQLFGYD